MWCFIDESWPPAQPEHVGVLAAAVGPRSDFEALGRFLYRIRRKYYGEAHARDLRSELKGSSLFSNASFRQEEQGVSINLMVAREAIEWTSKIGHPLRRHLHLRRHEASASQFKHQGAGGSFP